MKSRAEYTRTAIQAAKKAGFYIQKSLGKVTTTSYKGAINIVTDVDTKAEEMIIRRIKKSFPGHSILAEEKGRDGAPGEFTWIIDPLDGTTNFFRRFPFYCVSIALEHKKEVIAGVVYDPARKELFVAEKGNGAFLNGKRIRVSKVSKLSKGFVATGFAYGIKSAANSNIMNFNRFLKKSLAVRRAGAAALDLCYIACGIFDGFWEFDLNPWDCAAGYLLVREAGGKVTRFNGSKFSVYDSQILASNGKIHNQMSKLLI
ncbi:MAG: inositol monophosphatase family protein [Candidatus Omnitrophota bacterium]